LRQQQSYLSEVVNCGGIEMKLNLGRAILGGLVGTIAFTLLMYIAAPMMGIPRMDIAAMLGSMLGGWTMGMVMHFIIGVVLFPLIYAFVLFSKLRGAPVIKGILWGLTLWLTAGLLLMPMMGAGFFGTANGGMMTAAASLTGHLVYGALLGVIAGRPARRLVEAPAQS
jgi:uncharacterized membrane protein YagU involved in acid resistance